MPYCLGRQIRYSEAGSIKTRVTVCGQLISALSQSEEISSDFCCFYGGGIRHNEDIMHSFQNFIVKLIPNHPPPLETRIWKFVVRALVNGSI